MYLQSARLSEAENDISSSVTAYGNLGAIYNQLKESDSALFYLDKGLNIVKRRGEKNGRAFFYSNMGNVYYEKKEYAKALSYFQQSYQEHTKANIEADLWIDNLNISDVFI